MPDHTTLNTYHLVGADTGVRPLDAREMSRTCPYLPFVILSQAKNQLGHYSAQDRLVSFYQNRLALEVILLLVKNDKAS